MRRWVSIAAVVLVAVLVYGAWPFVDIARLGDALRRGDSEAVLARIDIPAVRRSVLNQVLDVASRDAAAGKTLTPLERSLAVGLAQSALERRFAALVNDDALRELLGDGRVPASLEAELRAEDSSFDARDIRFSGLPDVPFRYLQGWRMVSPNTVALTIGESGRPGDWTTFRMRRSGLVWRLVAVELPDSVVSRIEPALRRRLDAGQG